MVEAGETRPQARVVQVFAATLGAKGALMVVEVPLSLTLDWWEYAGWMSIANVAVAALVIVGLVGLALLAQQDKARALVRVGLISSVLTLGAWVARMLVAHDVLFVGFSARRTMHGIGMLGFAAMLVASSLALARMTPGLQATRVHELLRKGAALVVIGGSLALALGIASSGQVPVPILAVEVIAHVLFAIGLVCLAIAALRTSQAAELSERVADVFQ
ncbi:MAG: hypothetical protein CSA66_07335 [Proteobacteria bacterium]|nr:MAG: hypothetical protein CSA66_07335 [Pseudomonadota bacterium]